MQTLQRPDSTNSVQQRMTQAWQNRTASVTEAAGTKPTTKPTETVELTAGEKAAITAFIESLRAAPKKQDAFILLNKKLSSLSGEKREKFLVGIMQTLKNSEIPEDNILLKEKFNPAYSMYIAKGMLVTQLNEQSFAKIGQVPSEDDDDDDETDEI